MQSTAGSSCNIPNTKGCNLPQKKNVCLNLSLSSVFSFSLHLQEFTKEVSNQCKMHSYCREVKEKKLHLNYPLFLEGSIHTDIVLHTSLVFALTFCFNEAIDLSLTLSRVSCHFYMKQIEIESSSLEIVFLLCLFFFFFKQCVTPSLQACCVLTHLIYLD